MLTISELSPGVFTLDHHGRLNKRPRVQAPHDDGVAHAASAPEGRVRVQVVSGLPGAHRPREPTCADVASSEWLLLAA